MSRFLPKRKFGPRTKIGDREFVDAVLYRGKTGVPWRDLPERFGPWKSVYNRFANWWRRGVWKQIYKALQVRVDRTGSIVDGSLIRAHQDAAGGKGGSTPIVHAITDGKGRALIGDTGYDSDALVREIGYRGMKPVICCHPARKHRRRRLDRRLYRRRYRVECLFHDLKRFRAVASRYDKTAVNDLGMVEVACTWLWIS
ncbi:MAG: family transposase OrfA [Myxococcales bacterium]|nr:family transposase OrfA [Myxococcales bacterium]